MHKEWDIKKLEMDTPELKRALQTGYEPFAVKYTPSPIRGNVYIVWLKKNFTVDEE